MKLYNDSLATLTDHYQLTMSYSYWKTKRHEDYAAFNLFFRKGPFGEDFAISAGRDLVAEYLKNWRFEDSDLEYLKSLTGFEPEFLDYLSRLKFSCSVSTSLEGELVYPNTPMLTIVGPILQCQLLETPLLNIMNFQTLIATKAARIRRAAGADKISEFGLRRAQGPDGGLAASRAAFIGGCNSTSNVLAGKQFGIPITGTHAHSWVMSFQSELMAFRAYAWAMPDNCIFLVDTYDVKQGVSNAITVGQELRAAGHKIIGIRLDSGNLAALSIMARQMLDEAGFQDAIIVASNDLDEYKIADLKRSGARIDAWGVGTNLVTAEDQPALGGVYKLGAIYDHFDNRWNYRMKFSAEQVKTTNPGLLGIDRVETSENITDTLYNVLDGTYLPKGKMILRQLFSGGEFIDTPENYEALVAKRNRTLQTIERAKKLHSVGLSARVEEIKKTLMSQ